MGCKNLSRANGMCTGSALVQVCPHPHSHPQGEGTTGQGHIALWANPSVLEFSQYLFVGDVYLGMVDRRQVDTGGSLILMPQSLADDAQREILGTGDAGPRVACHVRGEGQADTGLEREIAQMVVERANPVQVLPAWIYITRKDDGEQIGRMGERIPVDDTLHGRFPFHTHLVSRLPAVVDQHASV